MLIDLEPRQDELGFFSLYYCENTLVQKGLNTRWVQANDSLSMQKATLRGLHFQTEPYAEMKLVRCVQGCICDVVVDIRSTSPTFRKYFAAQLSGKNRTIIYVFKAFAHAQLSNRNAAQLCFKNIHSYGFEYEQF